MNSGNPSISLEFLQQMGIVRKVVQHDSHWVLTVQGTSQGHTFSGSKADHSLFLVGQEGHLGKC